MLDKNSHGLTDPESLDLSLLKDLIPEGHANKKVKQSICTTASQPKPKLISTTPETQRLQHNLMSNGINDESHEQQLQHNDRFATQRRIS